MRPAPEPVQIQKSNDEPRLIIRLSIVRLYPTDGSDLAAHLEHSISQE